MGALIRVVIVKDRTAGLAMDCLRSIAGQSGPSLSRRRVVMDNDPGHEDGRKGAG